MLIFCNTFFISVSSDFFLIIFPYFLSWSYFCALFLVFSHGRVTNSETCDNLSSMYVGLIYVLFFILYSASACHLTSNMHFTILISSLLVFQWRALGFWNLLVMLSHFVTMFLLLRKSDSYKMIYQVRYPACSSSV